MSTLEKIVLVVLATAAIAYTPFLAILIFSRLKELIKASPRDTNRPSKTHVASTETYIQFPEELLERPERWSPEVVQQVSTLTDDEKARLSKLFKLFRVATEVHAQFFFSSAVAVKRQKSDSYYLWKTYFEILSFFHTLTCLHLEKNGAINASVRGLLYTYVTSPFDFMKYPVFEKTSFGSFKKAFEAKNTFYKEFIDRLIHSKDDVWRFPDLYYVTIQEPLSDKTDRISMTGRHLTTDIMGSVEQSLPFANSFAANYKQFNDDLRALKF